MLSLIKLSSLAFGDWTDKILSTVLNTTYNLHELDFRFSDYLPVNKFILVYCQSSQKCQNHTEINLKYILSTYPFSNLCRGVHDGVVEAGHGAVALRLLDTGVNNLQNNGEMMDCKIGDFIKQNGAWHHMAKTFPFFLPRKSSSTRACLGLSVCLSAQKVEINHQLMRAQFKTNWLIRGQY